MIATVSGIVLGAAAFGGHGRPGLVSRSELEPDQSGARFGIIHPILIYLPLAGGPRYKV